VAQKLPYYPQYPKDYLTDENVAVMSLEEEGAYRRLMDHCWIEGSIPDDLARLARLCRTSPDHMEAIWPAIRPCFTPVGDGRLDHPRLAIERRKAARKSRALSEAGARGAEKVWSRKPVKRKRVRPDGQAIARPRPGHGNIESESDIESNTESESRSKAEPSDASHRRVALDVVDPSDPFSESKIGRRVNALVARWIEQYHERPSETDIGKQGAAAKRIARTRTDEQCARAVHGIGHIAPHSLGQPWDLFDLEKRFANAQAAGQYENGRAPKANDPEATMRRVYEQSMALGKARRGEEP
jgi:uncharacterized protein YdaU (DUF1376 family)